jgi:hypothetical protein
MDTTSSSTIKQAVVDTKFCINSTTTFVVRKKPPVNSRVGGSWIIQDPQDPQDKKFELEELARREPGLALKDSGGNLILTVKPEDTMLDMILNFFGTPLSVKKQRWNVFLTMKPQHSFTVGTSGVNWKIEVPWTDYKFEGSFVDPGISQSPIFKIFHISRDNSRIAAAEVKLDNQVKLNNQVDHTKIYSVYDVKVEPGYDQAFIFGLVAVFEQIRLTKK